MLFEAELECERNCCALLWSGDRCGLVTYNGSVCPIESQLIPTTIRYRRSSAEAKIGVGQCRKVAIRSCLDSFPAFNVSRTADMLTCTWCGQLQLMEVISNG